MKKILGLIMGAAAWMNVLSVYATEKFEILPDLPEPLAAAQASSISTVQPESIAGTAQAIGHEPSIFTVISSLFFVILLIYASLIAVAKLNKLNNKTLRNQFGDSDNSRVSVISTTALGSNKTLHVVELDGKRMLIGASTNSIDLIKDLGSYPPTDIETGEFSKIEIPNIRIPKIEIPKIEFPNIGFTKAFKKDVNESDNSGQVNTSIEEDDDFTISEIYEESSDGIIDKLFTPNNHSNDNNKDNEYTDNETKSEHVVDPEEYALYKKYL